MVSALIAARPRQSLASVQFPDEPLVADHRNFYEVEKWSKDDQHIERMLWAGNSLDDARKIFQAEAKRRPRGRCTIRQRSRVLDQWPQGCARTMPAPPGDKEPPGAQLTLAEDST
jgi:hypothetical protein